MIKKIRNLAIGNTVAFLLAFTVSNLSQFGLLGLKNTMATVSAKYESVFTPAGLTFAIWGIIYLSLFAFCVYHLFHAFTKHADERVNRDVYKMGYLFMVNNLAVAAWVFAWLSEFLLASVILMSLQLISLLLIHIRLGIYDTRRALLGRVFSQFPLSIYFAWICIAFIANTSAYLYAIGWDAWGISPSHWAIMLIGIASLLSIFMIFIRKNVFFGLVVIWALCGIILKRNQIDPELYGDVILTAWSAITVLGLCVLIQWLNNFRSRRPYVH